MSSPNAARPVVPRPQSPLARLHAALMPDYNRKASIYWWTVTLLGAATVLAALWTLAALPWTIQLEIAFGCAIALLAGLFPVRIPGSKNSFAAGEVFIILMLLMHGPAAGILAAAGEAFVGAARSSKRWTSRLISPGTAALSMLLTGSALHAALNLVDAQSLSASAALVLLAMVFSIAHFLLNTLLITTVVHLKRDEPLYFSSFLGNFGWVGITYAGSALIAGALFLAFRATGVGVMAGAVPIMIALLVMLHYHFRQRESDSQAQQMRIDAAEREAAQAARHLQALRNSEQRFHSAFSHAAIGMALVSAEGEVLQANPALCHLLGREEAELLGRRFQQFVHAQDKPLLERQWHAVSQLEQLGSAVELRCERPSGDCVYVALHSGHFSELDASAPCLILQAQDITARRDAEARLHHIAYHDGLTSLANRMRFGACLGQAIDRCRAEPGYAFSVMYLDFDRFKLINDTLGHSAGDRFLTLVAQRIRDHVRPGDTVGRLGGDEFAILVDQLDDEASLLVMAERLQRALAEPYVLDGTEVNSSASIGITFSSVGYDSPGDVLRDADIAMYRAKAAGRARTALFDASLRAQLGLQVNLERDLRRALESPDAAGQLWLAYQPIYDLASGRVESFEALARWTHPERGIIEPGVFIPIAEDSALMASLTDWVLASACAQLRRFEIDWALPQRPRLHLNVSGTDMCRTNFVAKVAAALLKNQLEPHQLTLEITESMLMQRLDSALVVMGELRELGVGLSVDDFGTGYSSLAYLSTLPITSLKIDRSFVQRLQGDNQDAEVVKAVLTLGRALGKTVIAEGVETPAQLAQLRALGCAYAQGYLLARPQTADRAAVMLCAERRWPAAGATPSEFGRFVPTGFADDTAVLH